MIRIKTPSRIHLTLIDLNGSIGRVDGGAGITLEEPSIEITAEKSDKVEVNGDPQLTERMKKACEVVCPGEGISINIIRSYWNHIGLGSGTQAALAAGTAMAKLYGLNISARDIAFLIGRGGTSGIGIGAFETGGFILDGGHRMNSKKAFLPSSFSKGVPPAPILLRYEFPDWDIVLTIPPAKGAYDVYEKDMFAKLCPIPLNEVEKISHIILMQMLPAIVEKDMDNFGKAVNSIQEIGFKKRELDLQKGARELIDVIRSAGAAGAGMSSFGPAIYAVTDSPGKIESAVKKYNPDCIVIKTKAKNTGCEITYE
ncbi:beta-ribofuranosylaminobenzene 5'-phosphate synthase [Methanocella sp. CWC-04]|uniref:Beta-ribofuranosylaminobenzene 5'-phosphate synthase n=1 Tax=Methanooceanicella nereidis TaxID=2052831 RepID=A0AAP2W694_9EURY|nr:beta-ribofuranosylaminobenzene 5'-phosphate synthase [Methanocella sp. CWC-04]MCD1293846.1 beta-ribofuranosylaminobenzene 5'-phosphate synthase [Methanocella sp. CWC-04]